MRYALLLIIIVQCVWTLWSGSVNSLHESELIGNSEYFWSMFIVAALVDYYCIQLLTAMEWTSRSFKYFKYLIALLAASIGSHLIGCVGFVSSSLVLLQLYDTLAVLILAAELGIFVAYGMDYLRDRGVARSGASS